MSRIRNRPYNGQLPESFAEGEIEWSGKGLTLDRLRRHTDGRWSLEFALDTTATLPDGRIVRFKTPMVVSGVQDGRKPRVKPTKPREDGPCSP